MKDDTLEQRKVEALEKIAKCMELLALMKYLREGLSLSAAAPQREADFYDFLYRD